MKAQRKYNSQQLRGLIHTAEVLERAAAALNDAIWGAVADEERQHPIAKDWRAAQRACSREAKRVRSIIAKATGGAA